MKLSSRLLSCASMVRPGGVAADVGTDHGYLAVYLVEQGICPVVFASDIREEPLSAARRSAEKAGLTEQIRFCLSDGLRELPVSGIDTVICAGMGGENIIHILESEPKVFDPEKQLILQPQSKTAELRRWLGENGFSVRRESLSQDGKFIYTAMEAEYGSGGPVPPVEQYMPEALLRSGNPLVPAYFSRVKQGVLMTVEGLRQAKTADPEQLRFYEEVLAGLTEMEADYGLCK